MVYFTTSPSISRLFNIELFLGSDLSRNPLDLYDEDISVVGWGYRPSGQHSIHLSKYFQCPKLLVEDGFLLSLSPNYRVPCSLVVDQTGIYYDSTSPSDLENLLNQSDWITSEIIQEARETIDLKNKYNVSKYNHYISHYKEVVEPGSILLIDQVANDLSVKFGQANRQTFIDMLESALEDNPQSTIYVKTHPVTKFKRKRGYLAHIVKHYSTDRIKIIDIDVNPVALLKNFKKVYTVTSQLGFEALLLGLEVHTFGMPFYGGWGATVDRLTCSRRKMTRTIEELFAASYMLYSRHISPSTGEVVTARESIEYLYNLARYNIKNTGDIYCFGFRLFSLNCWKRERIRRYLSSTNNKIHFVDSVKDALKQGINSNSQIYVWGSQDIKMPEVCDLAENLGISIGHIEDGFVRSVGLGSDLVNPYSLAIDKNGIYYNPHSPSELETILQTIEFSDGLLDRARKLQQFIIKNNINKYNVQAMTHLDPFNGAQGKKVILAVGQVPKDYSIVMGCQHPINSNYRFLKKVRQENPDAFIIFKIHPDLIADNRQKDRIPLSQVLLYADQVDTVSSSLSLIDVVDEVHTMTSLTGFEAIIRGKTVVTYGQPFYAGWGLTIDYLPIKHRSRKLTVEELIAGALILYPTYYNWEIEQFDLPMNICRKIAKQKAEGIQLTLNSPQEIIMRRLSQVSKFIEELIKSNV